MSTTQTRTFSFLKFIRDMASGSLTGLEREMSQDGELCHRTHGVPMLGQAIIPPAALTMGSTRAVTAASEGAGLIGVPIDSFIGVLRNRLVMVEAGAQFLPDLSGTPGFPRVTAGSTFAWEGETDENLESTPTTDQVTLEPVRGGIHIDVSAQLLAQATPHAEALLRSDLAKAVAVGIQVAAVNGTGSGQPTGILNTAGIGSVAGGTNGLAPTWANTVAVRKEVGADDAARGQLGWLFNTDTVAKLQTTERVTDTGKFILEDSSDRLLMARVHETNSVPNDLTKGTGTDLSAMICGNFEDLLIGQWGGLDIVVDPMTKATEGLVRLIVNVYVDVKVRHPQSFAAMQDVITT